jgi:hypothetical protein
MYVVTATITRPDTSAEFWNLVQEPPEWQLIFDEAIRLGQALSFVDHEPTGDLLTYVRVFSYPDQVSAQLVEAEYYDLLPNFTDVRDEYEALHGHVRTHTAETLPDTQVFETRIRRRAIQPPTPPAPAPAPTPPVPAPTTALAPGISDPNIPPAPAPAPAVVSGRKTPSRPL